MFKKELKAFYDKLDSKITDISEKINERIDQLKKQFVNRFESEDQERTTRYILYLKTIIGSIKNESSDEINYDLLYNFEIQIDEISAFIMFHDLSNNELTLLNLFDEAINKVNEAHINKYGIPAATYDDWCRSEHCYVVNNY